MKDASKKPFVPESKRGSSTKDTEETALPGITRGWGKRFLSTGKLAASAARLAGRRLIGAEGEKDGLLGEALAHEMDKMKGMAMKVGQIISYFDGILPEETHKALRSLQQGAREVAFDQMQEVVEEAFGEPLESLYDTFATKPIASASIGQVYRGMYDGHDVAIKIQYPGVWDTIRSDFSVMHRLSNIASLASSVDGRAIVEAMQERFGEECDYLREAGYQNAFAEAFADVPEVAIPRVFDERTRSTVLTSEWCDGIDFYAFSSQASQDEKDRVAALLIQFAYESFFTLGSVNADPHPGNYLFPRSPDDDRVIFLDFGCVVAFDRELIEQERTMMQVLMQGRRQDFDEALLATGIVAKPKKFDFDHHWEMMRYMVKPYSEPHFHFTHEYIKGFMQYSGPTNPNMRLLAITPPWVWYQRLQWGLHAVLAQLNASGAFQAQLEEILTKPFVGLPAISAQECCPSNND